MTLEGSSFQATTTATTANALPNHQEPTVPQDQNLIPASGAEYIVFVSHDGTTSFQRVIAYRLDMPNNRRFAVTSHGETPLPCTMMPGGTLATGLVDEHGSVLSAGSLFPSVEAFEERAMIAMNRNQANREAKALLNEIDKKARKTVAKMTKTTAAKPG